MSIQNEIEFGYKTQTFQFYHKGNRVTYSHPIDKNYYVFNRSTNVAFSIDRAII